MLLICGDALLYVKGIHAHILGKFKDCSLTGLAVFITSHLGLPLRAAYQEDREIRF